MNARVAAEQRSWFERYVVESGFLGRYPFYASVLAQVAFATTEQVPVMAVRFCRDGFTLLLNERFFADRPQFLAGVLLHEVHHIVLGHLVHPRFFDAERPDLLQLAMEMSANEYITEPLPKPIVWSQFQQFGIGPHQSTLGRYGTLLGNARTFDAANRLPPRWLDHHGGDGLAGTGIVELVTGRESAGQAIPALRLLLERAQRICADLDAGPAAASADAAAHPDSRLQLPGQGDGRLLGRNLDAVLALLAPAPGGPTIDWRIALRDFLHRGSQPTFHRPNRRQPKRVFELPGRTWRGGQPEILVAIDTSGSMDDTELLAIARELGALARAAHITIAECDDRIRRIYRFRGQLADVVGRGGTDLRPVFAPELLAGHGRDGVVYFTDGDGPFPERPPSVPTLWVLTQPNGFRCPWGRRTWIRPTAAEPDDPDYGDIPF